MKNPFTNKELGRPSLIGVLVFFLVLGIAEFIAYQEYLIIGSAEEEEISAQAERVEYGIERILNQGFSSSQILAFTVENYGVPENFPEQSQLLLDTNYGVDALELVDSTGTITHVYPLKGNEVLGFNILQDSIGKPGALKTIEKGEYFISGPIPLKQGGSGFVCRTPIYIKNRFAGFSAAVIKLQSLLKSVPISPSPSNRFNYQLTKVNTDGSEEVFYSSDKEQSYAGFKKSITDHNGEWKLYVISNNDKAFFSVYIFAILGFLFAALSGFLVSFLIKQPLKLQSLVQQKTSELTESEQKFRTLIEQASDGIFLTDFNGKVLDVNLKGLEMFGYNKQEMLQKNLTNLAPPNELEKRPIRYAELSIGQAILTERQLLKKDGSSFFGEVSAKKLNEGSILGIVRDVSSRKELELIAQSNLEKFQKAFNSSTIGMAIFDSELKFVDANSCFLEMIGFSLEEILGNTLEELGPMVQNEGAKRKEAVAALEKQGKVSSMDLILKRKDGKELHLITSAEIYQNDGRDYILATYIDRTEAKKAQQKTRESEEKYRVLVQNASDGIILLDEEANFLDANIKLCEMLGYSLNDLLGMNAREVIDVDDLKNTPLKIEELKSGKTVHTKRKLIRSDFSNVLVEANIKMLPNNTFQGIIRDITEKEKAANLIADSEKKYRELTERISDAFVALDKDWNFIYVNKKASKIIQKDPSELVGKNLWKEFPEFAQTEASPTFLGALDKQKYVFFEQFHKPFGTWIENHIYPSPEGLTIYFRDVTKKKIAEQEKQKLLTVVEKSPSFIGLSSLEGDSIYLNDFGKKLVGLSPEDSISDRSWFDFFPEGSEEIMKEEYIPQIFNEGYWSGEAYLRSFDGNTFTPTLFSAFLINDINSNEPIGIGSVAFDLTDRKKAEREILDLQAKMNAAIRIGKIGYWDWHIESETIEWSDRMYQIYDVDPGKTINVPFTKTLVHPEDLELHDRIIAERTTTKDNSSFTYRIVHRDGAVKHVLVQMEVKFNDEGKATNYVGTAMDITQEKEAEELLENQNKELKKTNSELDSFVYSASHELRAPLASLLGLLDIIKKEEKEPEKMFKLGLMENSITRLDEFISDIIEYSRNKHLELKIEKINFSTLIDKSLEDLWYLENTSRITIIKNIQEDAPFYSDKRRIVILMNNFISNAIKYHDMEKSNPSIWITIQTKKEESVIKIKDNGTGIAKSYQDKIYNMFYRASTKVMGSGIGLYIVKEILEKLGGTVDLDSTPKEGSTFTLKIPNNYIED